MIYKGIVFPLLRALSRDDAEVAHEIALDALRTARNHPIRSFLRLLTKTRGLERELFGVAFKNPIGFSAGIDKHGTSLMGLEALGFGFGEVGTITPRPQMGNPRPRLFRLMENHAIINRMGFNSVGASVVRENISVNGLPKIPIGLNVGANNTTLMSEAWKDYLMALTLLYPIASYITFNVSSPNTPDLRSLQAFKPLRELLEAGQKRLEELRIVHQESKSKPLVVKVAPDLKTDELDAVLQVITDVGVAGIIYENTTLDRPSFLDSEHQDERGGLSGPFSFLKTRRAVRYIKSVNPRLPVIAVGGLSKPEQVLQILEEDGADLVQIYTSFVYRGPMLPSKMARGIWTLGARAPERNW